MTYHPPRSNTWYLKRPNYKLFMIRELTSLFILAYLFCLIRFIDALATSEEAWKALMADWQTPGWRFAHGLMLLGAIWHSVTWFNVTPKAMPLYLGENKVSAPIVAILMGYGPWLTVSAVILWGVMYS